MGKHIRPLNTMPMRTALPPLCSSANDIACNDRGHCDCYGPAGIVIPNPECPLYAPATAG